MNRIFLFGIVVVLGVVGLIIISNTNLSSNKTLKENVLPTILLSPSPAEPSFPTVSSSVSADSSTQENQQNETFATIKTSKGDIEVSFYIKEAPKTVENFTKKAKSGFYNNLTFHRIEDWVAQGGDPKGNGTGGGEMPTELNDKPFIVGSLGVARKQDIKVSNDAQFFITKKDSPFLNNQYTNFGIVTKGINIVNMLEVGDKILGITLE